MKVLTCPSLYNNNFLSVTCPDGFQNGGKCSFSCKIGSELIGQNITTCGKSKDGDFAIWDFKDKYPYCEVHRRCVNDLDPPKNGAVACDTWLDGKFCQVQCHKDYDFKPGYPFYEMLVCGDSGKWEPETAIPIPDCSKAGESETEQGFEDIQDEMLGVLTNETENGTLAIVLDGNVTLIATDMAAEKVVFQCPNNTFASYKTSSCEACPRGQWSVTGVTPCSPCPLGSYGEDIGSTVCAACPISQTTLTQGSSPLVVSQFNIWSASYDEEKLRNESNRCVINETGDVFPWKQWENAHLEGGWIQIPSMCDDINECDEHPCGNNTCNNELGGVTCECNLGYRGTYCEENIDDCLTSICQNNSTCVDGINEYSCICPPNYKGDLCETLFLHGNWSKWDEWSQCSETCGNGTKSRKRYCTNPAPYNGGKFCTGNHTEVTHCNVKECPGWFEFQVCSLPEAPDNGTLNCTGSPHTGFNCTIACNSGFSFDRGVKPYYECGPTTLFLWDFNSDDNPNGDLPTCNPVQESKELSANFRALYEDLYCDEENNDIINAKINVNVELFLEELPCRQKMTCNTTDFVILNCGKEPTRKKRSLDPSKMTAGFQVKFLCSAMTLGSEICAEELIGAITSFEEPASRSKLAVNVSNTMYEIDSNQTSASGEVQCDPGYVSSGISCVPCGVGNFFLDGLCRKCEYGFYQDELGQTGCKHCPPGTTTPGRASRRAESCSGELYTGIGTSIATLVVVVAIMTAVIFKVRKLELKLGEGAVKLQKKDCQPDAFNFQEEDANVVSLCTIRRLDDNGVPLT
uniref:Sushi, von Willebrand factor type A, EGF and pentraxin domain-containing protein 1 n=1 Tax=Magallana gigas TaxID=29159 RepID=K1RFG7_MAGGI